MTRKATPKKAAALKIHGTELLRLCHAAAGSGKPDKQAAAESLYSLLAFRLTQEIVLIPQEMVPHYKTVTS